MTPQEARLILRNLVKDSSRVFFTNHAEQRMIERGITRIQVFRCLEHGQFEEQPAKDARGSWSMRIRSFSAGDAIAVALALDVDEHGDYGVVITVMR